MWASIGEAYDGRSKDSRGREVPWSAAFISFVVRKAGDSYKNFKFANAHSVFAHDAIQARFQERRDSPFWGYRVTEQRPTLGNIVLRNRDRGRISFDYAERNSRYYSHSDIVVEATTEFVRVVGGNVNDSVSMSYGVSGRATQEYQLDKNGFIKRDQGVIAILKNITTGLGDRHV